MTSQPVFLFPGQGAQTVGMGKELAASHDGTRLLFARADETLGLPLSQILFEGPAEELKRTENLQPALLAFCVAEALYLREHGVVPSAAAGHSLGQYAALVVAGSLSFEDGLRLVKERGRLMQESVPEGVGSMGIVVGMPRMAVYEACDDVRGVVNVACHNAPEETVVAGEAGAVSEVLDLCEDRGGSVVELAVSAPFHCPLLEPMLPAFRDLLADAPFSDPLFPVIDNVSAKPLQSASAVRDSLFAQVTAPVLFEESLKYLLSIGHSEFVQCGPGKTMRRYVSKLSSEASVVRRVDFELA